MNRDTLVAIVVLILGLVIVLLADPMSALVAFLIGVATAFGALVASRRA